MDALPVVVWPPLVALAAAAWALVERQRAARARRRAVVVRNVMVRSVVARAPGRR